MRRLPGAEVAAFRLEASVFGCLALAGVVAILLATASCVRFVAGRDAVVVALEGRSVLEAVSPANATLSNPTNVTRMETKAVVASDPNKA